MTVSKMKVLYTQLETKSHLMEFLKAEESSTP